MNKNNNGVRWIWLVLFAVIAAVAHWAANASAPLIIAAAIFTPLCTHATIMALQKGVVFKVAAIWLLLPYGLFAIYWLNAIASIMVFLAVFTLWWQLNGLPNKPFTVAKEDNFALVLGLVWFSLAGIGGVGYQTLDWIMHNGRLVDLILHDWPVIYREGTLINSAKWSHDVGVLTGYFAFQLPAAWVGKQFDSIEIAKLALYIWAWMGFALLLVAAKLLDGIRRPLLMLMGLALFAGSDILFYCYELIFELLTHGSFSLPMQKEDLDGPFQWIIAFWTVEYFGYFFGVFLPLATQFHLAPNQVIAIWLAAIGLLYCHQQQRYPLGVAWIALLFFWSPFGAIGLAFFWGLLTLQTKSIAHQLRAWPIMLSVCVLLIVFAGFYRVLDASVASGVMGFSWQQPGVVNFWRKLVVFHVISWGVYAAIIALAWPLINQSWRQVLLATLMSLIVISVLDYGFFSDLKMRAAAGLYLLLMLGLIEVFRCLWSANKRWLVCILCFVAVLSALTHAMYLVRDVMLFNTTHDYVSVIDYRWGYEFLRRANDIFMCYLSSQTDYCFKS